MNEEMRRSFFAILDRVRRHTHGPCRQKSNQPIEKNRQMVELSSAAIRQNSELLGATNEFIKNVMPSKSAIFGLVVLLALFLISPYLIFLLLMKRLYRKIDTK